VLFVSKLSAGQWAEARRLRAEGASFRAIAEALGVSRDSISKRARREGWHTPSGMDADPRAQPARALPDDVLQARRALRQRIFRILDLDLTIMELRMQKRLSDAEIGEASEGMSKEELARLATFKQTIQDHTELSPDTEPTAGAARRARAGGNAPASEADVFRREMAERIEKLIPPE
jgi:IS30 family transposase